MSDTSQGPGWWRASNGLWYPPEAKPGPRRPTEGPGAAGDADRRPPGVPERPPSDPKVQPPFTPRRVESIEPDRERERERARGREEPPRRVPWGWIGVILLVLAFGGLGTWLALTAGGDDGDDDVASAPERDDGDATGDATSTTDEQGTSSLTAAPTSTTADDGRVEVFALEQGDCFNARPEDADDTADSSDDAADGALVTTVELLDCDEPHLAEVVDVVEMSADPEAAFPGAAARDAEAQTRCQEAFEAYVGSPFAESELGLVWLAPTEESWEDEGDREVTCAAQSLSSEPLVGSVAGSGR